jgi:hypothetical protein
MLFSHRVSSALSSGVGGSAQALSSANAKMAANAKRSGRNFRDLAKELRLLMLIGALENKV